MRILIVLATCIVMTTSSICVPANEFTHEQKEVWSALENQVALFFKQDWEAEKKYIHPKAVFWVEGFPVPFSPVQTAKYDQAVFAEYDEVIAHQLIPVTVQVVDDVAIINFYLRILTRPDDEAEEVLWRGHNTWKKDNNGWRLLAICNGKVESESDDDD